MHHLVNADYLRISDVKIKQGISTSINDSYLHNLTMFPNPFKETIYIESAQPLSNCSIIITDVIGSVIKEIKENTFINQLNTSDIKQGIYFFTFTDNKNRKTYRVVKQ